MQDRESLRIEKYRTASAEVRELYASPDLGSMLRIQFSSSNLPEEKYRSFVDVFGDVILQLEERTTLVSKLIGYFGLAPEIAQGIVTNVLSVIDMKAPLDTTLIDVNEDTTEIRPDDFKPIVKVEVDATLVTPAPAVRVMPHTPQEAAASQVRSGTELPNSLLKNLQASLAHSAPEEIPDDTPMPQPSYNTFLGKTPPTP